MNDWYSCSSHKAFPYPHNYKNIWVVIQLGVTYTYKYNPIVKDPGQNGHTPKRPHPKRPQLFWLPKRPQPKRPHCIGQNGHTGRITTKTAKLHLVKTATQGGSLPKRPHCIWSKRPQREDHYQNAFGQNGHKGRITTKTATQYNCGVAVLVATCVHSRHTN